MRHIRLEIVAAVYQQEELIALLDDYEATGFEQTDKKLVAYFEEGRFAEAEINNLLKGFSTTVSLMEATNWNEEWERNFEPVVVGNFCAVRAHFHPVIAGVEHQIIITPKMSFGTGHHATTYMMMEQMQDMEFADKTVFDFGTGTGILAILAGKLGAAAVTAIDNDEWSIENTRENIGQNSMERITTRLSATLPEQSFDIILANINRNVILDYLPALASSLISKGQILFSGLLISDKKVIVAAGEQHNLLLQRELERNGWVSLLFITN